MQHLITVPQSEYEIRMHLESIPLVVLFFRTYRTMSRFSQTIRISTAPISSAFSVSCTPKQYFPESCEISSKYLPKINKNASIMFPSVTTYERSKGILILWSGASVFKPPKKSVHVKIAWEWQKFSGNPQRCNQGSKTQTNHVKIAWKWQKFCGNPQNQWNSPRPHPGNEGLAAVYMSLSKHLIYLLNKVSIL